jgi:hypothetical protein
MKQILLRITEFVSAKSAKGQQRILTSFVKLSEPLKNVYLEHVILSPGLPRQKQLSARRRLFSPAK